MEDMVMLPSLVYLNVEYIYNLCVKQISVKHSKSIMHSAEWTYKLVAVQRMLS